MIFHRLKHSKHFHETMIFLHWFLAIDSFSVWANHLSCSLHGFKLKIMYEHITMLSEIYNKSSGCFVQQHDSERTNTLHSLNGPFQFSVVSMFVGGFDDEMMCELLAIVLRV